MIIGVCGLIGSGKGTVADMLVEDHGFKKISFADKLKDAVATMFDWDRDMLEGDTDVSRKWREVEDEFWTKETGRSITPRLVLQLFGTECMRNGFHKDIWVNIVKQQILKNPQINYVIPDTRFPNELKMVRDVGGEVWWVKRGNLPEWWSHAILDNTTGSNLMDQHNIHPSEWSWADTNDSYDAIIYNDSTMQVLKDQVLDHLV